MEETYAGPLRYILGGVCLIVVAVIAKKVYDWFANAEERHIQAQLRSAIDGGDLATAAQIQERRGMHLEAARIYQRIGDHAQAGAALVRAGNESQAAEEFEKAKDFARAGNLYKTMGNMAKAAACLEQSPNAKSRLAAAACYATAGEHLKAGRIFQDLEQYDKAADAYSQVEDLDALHVALTMLENAALANTAEPAKKKEFWKRAAELAVKLGAHERAARAFDESGDLLKAANIYENALKRFDVAAALYTEAGSVVDATRATEAAGSGTIVVETRLARARERGDKDLADRLTTQLEALTVSGKATVATKVTPGAGGKSSWGGALDERFELLGELGRGGMGVVYKAKDRVLGRLVALKFLPDDVEDGSVLHKLFHREARAAAALSHPSIVTVFDVSKVGEREFICMELVDGETLDRMLEKNGPLEVPVAVDIMEKTLCAIEYAHRKSVIHRDIKPANIMRTGEGVKVMDFGLAKIVSHKTSAGKTVIAGTPHYMPPEQSTGNTDHRADVFAIGATFYELLTGVLPGSQGSSAAQSSSYPSVRQRAPHVPARLSELIMQCLEHDRDLRPHDVVGLLQEVRAIRSSLAVSEGGTGASARARPAVSPVAAEVPAPGALKSPRAPLPRIAREEDDGPSRTEVVEVFAQRKSN